MTAVVHLQRSMAVHARPGSPRVTGTLQARSRYLGSPLAVPLLAASPDGRWGKVRLPWRADSAIGWIELRGLRVTLTDYRVVVHRRSHELEVLRGTRVVARMPAGTGAAASPTPRGSYFVTEQVAVPSEQRASFGSRALGLSGLQRNLPRGWRGKDQLAIHGTGDPASVGRSASAGCVRLGERDLARLAAIVRPGTPVDVVD